MFIRGVYYLSQEEQGVCADESRVRDWVIKAVQHHLLVTCSPNGSGETFASCVHHQPPYKFIIRCVDIAIYGNHGRRFAIRLRRPFLLKHGKTWKVAPKNITIRP